MATARKTFGSVLGAVTSAAEAVGSAFETVTTTVDMGHEFVTNAARNQKIRNALNESSFEEALITDLAMEDTKREVEVIAFCKDEKSQELFTKHSDRLRLALAKAKGTEYTPEAQVAIAA